MMKKISVLLVIILIFLLFGCSREAKFGVGEFADRINKDFDKQITENSVSLEKDDGKNRIYCKIDDFLLVLYLGNNNNICGVAMMLPIEEENKMSLFFDDFTQCVSVFTNTSYSDAKSTLNECSISSESIKFTDSNKISTVGKFKYSVITNEMSVTLFCERV